MHINHCQWLGNAARDDAGEKVQVPLVVTAKQREAGEGGRGRETEMLWILSWYQRVEPGDGEEIKA